MVEAIKGILQMAVAHGLECLPTVAGYIVACLIGHVVARWAVGRLWRVADKHLKDLKAKGPDFHIPPEPIRPPPAVSFWHGVAERSIYTTAAILKPEGIAVWLGFKAIM